MRLAGVDVDGVEPRADPADDAEVGQRGDDTRGDRRILQQDAGAAAGRFDHLRLLRAFRELEVEPRTREDLALEPYVGKVVVGEQDLHQ